MYQMQYPYAPFHIGALFACARVHMIAPSKTACVAPSTAASASLARLTSSTGATGTTTLL